MAEALIAQLTADLPSYIVAQRWYRSKARTIRSVSIIDLVPLSVPESFIAIVRIEYSDGGEDHYQLPLLNDTLEALTSSEFRQSFLDAIACEQTFHGRAGALSASRTIAFRDECGSGNLQLDSFVSRAEQSNTSIVYGDRFILKFFRKLEAGINPDIEIGAFLTRRQFKNTPAVLGLLQYRPSDDTAVYAAAILQAFVRNEGDAWKYTLESLAGYFERALSSEIRASADTADELIGDFIHSAELLGRRTAEMHAALADFEGGEDFAPEPCTPEDLRKLRTEMLHQADLTFAIVRQKLPGSELLSKEDEVRERFNWLAESRPTAMRIRYHGDYHLGQVLYTGSDFMIIDFEGEPARPLSERRGKTLAMRDVAGMIRSFEYAAYTAAGSRPEAESWAGLWTSSVGAAFQRGYFNAAANQPFVPSPDERQPLLDAFLLHKALYEVAYELNNRPDWVRIPLRGILKLIN